MVYYTTGLKINMIFLKTKKNIKSHQVDENIKLNRKCFQKN